MTLTRCVARLDSGATGFGYVAGRGKRHAELAALFDALLQTPERSAAILDGVIAPLAAEQKAHRQAQSREAAATRVDFFTLVRGESG
jgi:alpha-D-ribose 1-methylphosphonate 5-triphosphate synthase subunit PhnG